MALQAVKEDQTPETPTNPPRNRKPLFIALGALALAGAGTWWMLAHGIEDTDDAQIDGDVVSVPARTSGVVTAIHFDDNQLVKAGDLLAEIDPLPALAKLEQAEAELQSAQATAESAAVQAKLTATTSRSQESAAKASLAGAKVGMITTAHDIAEADAQLAGALAARQKAAIDLARARQLLATHAIPASQGDAAQAAYDAAEAQLAQAHSHAMGLRANAGQVQARIYEASARYSQAATVEQQIRDAEARAKVAQAGVENARATRDLAALELSYTRILAPQDGIVSKRAINVGQMVTSGSPIVALVPTARIWVTGNFKETQLEHMRLGQPATVKIDAYGTKIHGRVESFSAATGAKFSLLPPDNASGNYTKIVQRVPVRIALTDVPQSVALRPGLSVDLAINTRK